MSKYMYTLFLYETSNCFVSLMRNGTFTPFRTLYVTNSELTIIYVHVPMNLCFDCINFAFLQTFGKIW